MKWLFASSLILALFRYAWASPPILSWSIFTFNTTLSTDFYASQLRAARSLPGLSNFDTVAISTTSDTIAVSGASNGTNPLIAAALATQTKLIVSLARDYTSSDYTFSSDLASLTEAISDPVTGYQLANLIVGILIGSNDLQSAGGVLSNTTFLASIDQYSKILEGVRSQLQSTILRDVPIGHMEVPEVWANPVVQPILSSLDFVTVFIYPTDYSSVQNVNDGVAFFNSSMTKVRSAIGDKPLWVQTGWPTHGNTTNFGKSLSIKPSVADANTYWDSVGCAQLFNVTNTIWEAPNGSLQLNYGDTPAQPADTYNLVDSSNHPLFNFSCTANSTSDQVPDTGLTTAAKAGIGVGVGIGGALILAAVVYTIWRLRRQRKITREKSAYHGVGVDEYAEPGVAVDS